MANGQGLHMAPESLPKSQRGWTQRQLDRALRWWQRPAVAVLASAMIVGQMGVLAAVVKMVYPLMTDTSLVTPLSGSRPALAGVVLKVAFKPDATAAQIQAAIGVVQGRVVGGPGALGLWEVEVPMSQQATAARRLEQSAGVESVTQE